MEDKNKTTNNNSKSGPHGQIDNGNPSGGGDENIPKRTPFFNFDFGRVFLHDDIMPNVKLVTESRG